MQQISDLAPGHRRDAEGDRGFTFVELVVVIAVLGVLSGVAVFALGNIGGTSLLSACNSRFNDVETALKTYQQQMGNYPAGVGVSISGYRTDSDPVIDETPTDTNYLHIVNAAGQMSGAQSNALGSELLTGSMSETNNGFDANGNGTSNVPLGQSVGPWLKDLPQSGTAYYIWVPNDGSGKILVGKGSNYGAEPNTNNTSCGAAGIG